MEFSYCPIPHKNKNMSSAQDLLTQFTGVTFSGDDDPQIQSLIQELLDDFSVDALRVEAAAEDRLLEEVGTFVFSPHFPREMAG